MTKCLSFSVTVLITLLTLGQECSARKTTKCNKQIDLGITIDASASMGEKNFKTAKKFAKKLLDRFVIAPSQTRVSLNYFSYYHHIVTKFDDDVFAGDLKTLIKNMEFENSFTCLDKATSGLSREIFPENKGSRASKKGSKMVAVFLTDAFGTNGYEQLKFHAKDLRNLGVESFIVQVFGENSNDGIDALASEPTEKHTFTLYRNPKMMYQELDRLVRQICK